MQVGMMEADMGLGMGVGMGMMEADMGMGMGMGMMEAPIVMGMGGIGMGTAMVGTGMGMGMGVRGIGYCPPGCMLACCRPTVVAGGMVAPVTNTTVVQQRVQAPV